MKGSEMKQLMSILLSILAVFFLSACGDSSTSADTEPEVYGPGGAFAGATEFSYAMIAKQTIYTFNEEDNIWIGVIFHPDGQVIYEVLDGKEFGDTYSIEDGKIVVKDSDDNEKTTIALDVAKDTVWEVTGTDDDGKVWQDTWHLELKFRSDMLVGKKFLSKYINDGIAIEEELLYTDTTLKIYTTEGVLKSEFPYRLVNGSIIITGDEGEYNLYLMSIEDNGNFNIWYLTESQSAHSVWTPINN